jgi:hypothetical protein
MPPIFKSKEEIAEYYIETRGIDPEAYQSAMMSLAEQLHRYLGSDFDEIKKMPEQKMRKRSLSSGGFGRGRFSL